jgi:uncharacterized protein
MHRQTATTFVALCFALCLSLLSACSSSGPTVEFKGERFSVELAEDPASQARGMMFRDSLAPDAGMLFIFPDSQPRSFWMHNCRIALDILYFDAERKLVGSALSVPPCNLPPQQCPTYPSGAPAKYVLELSAGSAKRLGVQLGDRFQLAR